jgi:hypothetical protein
VVNPSVPGTPAVAVPQALGTPVVTSAPSSGTQAIVVPPAPTEAGKTDQSAAPIKLDPLPPPVPQPVAADTRPAQSATP